MGVWKKGKGLLQGSPLCCNRLRREDTDSGRTRSHRTVTTHSPAPLGPTGAVPRLLCFDRPESTVHSQLLAPGPETKLTVRKSHPVTT